MKIRFVPCVLLCAVLFFSALPTANGAAAGDIVWFYSISDLSWVKHFRLGMSRGQVSAILKAKYNCELRDDSRYRPGFFPTEEYPRCGINLYTRHYTKDGVKLELGTAYKRDGYESGMGFIFAGEELVQMKLPLTGKKADVKKLVPRLKALYGGRVVTLEGDDMYLAETKDYAIYANVTSDSRQRVVVTYTSTKTNALLQSIIDATPRSDGKRCD